MASRKKNEKTPGASVSSAPTDAPDRAIAVVLEDMSSQFKVFGEALQGVREDMNRRFGDMDRRFEQVDRRFEQVDRRFEQIDGRLEQNDGRFDRMDREIGLVKTAVIDNSREVRELRTVVTRIEAALEKKVDRDEVEAIVARAQARR